MFWRVHADLAFTVEDEANDFYHDCEVALPKASIINPDERNEERGTILLEKCFHDLNPSIPCHTIKENMTPYPPD